MKSFAYFILVALFTSCSLHSKQSNMITEEYLINTKTVSRQTFDNFLSNLQEIPSTWYCAETNDGGRTGYKLKDSTGNVYVYVSVSKASGSKNSITQLPE